MSCFKTNETFVKEVFELVGSEYTVLGTYVNGKTKINMRHNVCGKEFNITPSNFLQGMRCSFCYGIYKTHKRFAEEVFNLVGNEYIILNEYVNSKTKVKMKHTICGNEFDVQPGNFLQGTRCPYCAGKKVALGFNSIFDTNKTLFSLLANPEDGYKYTEGSNKKVDWKCPECGQIIYKKGIMDVKNQGLCCSNCSDGISYPNRLMFSVLSSLKISFDTEKSFEWCQFIYKGKNYRGIYDFYFTYKNKEYIIEMDGEWHFKDNPFSGQTKEDSDYIDKQKDALAIQHNIYPVRIDSRQLGLEYIKKEIIKSDLNYIFDLSSIDWGECERHSTNSLKKQACDLWDKYNNILIIAKIMKRTRETIRAWLKHCNNIGLCDYKPVSSRKVICIETDEIFNFVKSASDKYNICATSISACCRGRRKSAGKLSDGTQLHWKYVD